MTFTALPRPRIARRAGVPAAALCLLILAAGCASGAPGAGTTGGNSGVTSGSPASHDSPRPAAAATPGSDLRALAAAYLAIAKPANHRLDTEVDDFTDSEHDDLAAARSDLRAQAATERWFDRRLLKIAFPPQIAATARALIAANQSRVALTHLQARASSIAMLLSLDRRHRAADAAVEVQVRTIRRELGLAPPDTS